MNRLKKAFTLLVFLSGLLSHWIMPTGFAQSLNNKNFILKPEKKFEHLTMTEGLSNSMVYSMARDKNGFMWFGTMNGLNRYDGYNFTIYKHDPLDSSSLSDNTIHAIMPDGNGKIWIGTANGLNLFDPSTEKAVRYYHQSGVSGSLSSNFININALYMDRQGILWIGTNDGLNTFNPHTHTFTHYLHQSIQVPSLISGSVGAIFEDRKGTLWVGTGKGLNSLSIGQESFHTPDTDPKLQPSASWQFIYSFCEDNLGFLWVSTNIGIFRRDPTTGIFEKFKQINTLAFTILKDSQGTIWICSFFNGLYAVNPSNLQIEHYEHNPTETNGLASNQLYSMVETQSGILWIGTTNNGINKLDLTKRQFTVYRPYLDNATSIKNAHVHSIYEDDNRNIWIGTSGNGLLKLEPQTGKVKMYKYDTTSSPSQNTSSIFEIREDKSGMFWIGTYWGGLYYFNPQTGKFISYLPEPGNPKSISDSRPITFLQEQDGALWIGTAGNGLNYFDPKTHQFTRYIHDPTNPNSIGFGQINSIIKDDKGDLWLTTEGSGLNRMERKTGHFHSYKHNPNDSNSISSDIAMYVYQDQTNTLWVGTRAGLDKMDTKTGKFTTYTTRHGLPDNYIVGIIEDSKGTLWISTKNGLCSFNPQKEVFQTYDMGDGLNTNDFKIDCLYKAKDGKMYFGGVNGFTVFHPDSIRSNTYVPPVHITGFKIFDKKVNLDEKEVELAYRDNFFSFDFVALNYHNTKKNQYAYMLVGIDKDWVYSGIRRYASYTDVSPGKYTFLVKGSNNDGIWNEQGASIKIIIHPPFWRTWWAYGFYFLCLFTCLVAFDRYQRRRLIEREREKTRERELQQARELEKAYKELGQQKEELQTTLEDLQATQTQLIQKEKMASLGELTAGIAHEIQNPLNFVNNFSEVNKELIEELELEIDKGNIEEVKLIINDLKENEDKVMLHGKRADSIVKNMLQHSRASGGEKQPTDINPLVDEYLRLAYHGLRAKDKDFNAKLITDFDEKVPKTEIVSQEIGRVLLNLFNNAFYAVNLKKAGLNGQYQPQITVTTKALDGKVEIRIRDNGTGIPESVKQKIFQPFFTTKPTGEGTGLGLSLSYDIITKGHGGEMQVQSKEGEFTEFITSLPLR
jgi:ligand-binding sensor domain-containing protein/signal transduction histidine kinase